jgi:phage terminase large subunit
MLTFEAGHKILFTRLTMVSANISIIPELVDKIDLLGLSEHFRITKTEIINTSGSSIIFMGIEVLMVITPQDLNLFQVYPICRSRRTY